MGLQMGLRKSSNSIAFKWAKVPSESKGAWEVALQTERAQRWEVEAAGVLEFVQLSILLPGALRSNLQLKSINNLNSALKEELKWIHNSTEKQISAGNNKGAGILALICPSEPDALGSLLSSVITLRMWSISSALLPRSPEKGLGVVCFVEKREGEYSL